MRSRAWPGRLAGSTTVPGPARPAGTRRAAGPVSCAAGSRRALAGNHHPQRRPSAGSTWSAPVRPGSAAARAPGQAGPARARPAGPRWPAVACLPGQDLGALLGTAGSTFRPDSGGRGAAAAGLGPGAVRDRDCSRSRAGAWGGSAAGTGSGAGLGLGAVRWLRPGSAAGLGLAAVRWPGPGSASAPGPGSAVARAPGPARGPRRLRPAGLLPGPRRAPPRPGYRAGRPRCPLHHDRWRGRCRHGDGEADHGAGHRGRDRPSRAPAGDDVPDPLAPAIPPGFRRRRGDRRRLGLRLLARAAAPPAR